MRGLRSRVAALGAMVLAVVGVGLGAAPSSGATGYFDVAGGVLHDGCQDVSYDFAYESDPGAVDWEVEATVYDPIGNESTSTYDWGSGSFASGSDTLLICGSEGAGRYHVSVDVTFYDDNFDVYDGTFDETSFVMRPQPTRTALRVSDTSPRFNQVVRFRVKSRERNPVGWRANDYEYVALDIACRGGDWVRVRRSKTFANRRGVAVLRYRWNVRQACRVKAVTLRTVNSAQSTSAAKRVKTVRTRGSSAAGSTALGVAPVL